MGRIAPIVEGQLTDDQASFCPECLCYGQVVNLTKYIQRGFETYKITSAVFVDLLVAYDSVTIVHVY